VIGHGKGFKIKQYRRWCSQSKLADVFLRTGTINHYDPKGEYSTHGILKDTATMQNLILSQEICNASILDFWYVITVFRQPVTK
jgi:hypothetical protein